MPVPGFVNQIRGADKVTDWFGYWPTFHDAEVLWIKLERGSAVLPGNVSIECVIHTWELTDRVDATGHLKMEKECVIHFRFVNCASISLEGFNQQNQLYSLVFGTGTQVLPANKIVPEGYVVYVSDDLPNVAEEYLEVTFDSAFGVGGSFKCFFGEVVSVTAYNPEGASRDLSAA